MHWLLFSSEHSTRAKFLITSLIAGPPKALDEDETEFLDKLELVK